MYPVVLEYAHHTVKYSVPDYSVRLGLGHGLQRHLQGLGGDAQLGESVVQGHQICQLRICVQLGERDQLLPQLPDPLLMALGDCRGAEREMPYTVILYYIITAIATKEPDQPNLGLSWTHPAH